MKRAAAENDDPLFTKLIHLSENAETIWTSEASAMVENHWQNSVYHDPDQTRDLHPWIAQKLTETAKLGQKEWQFHIFNHDNISVVYFIDCTAASWKAFSLWYDDITDLPHQSEFTRLSTPVYKMAAQMLTDRTQVEKRLVLANICAEWNKAHPRIRARLVVPQSRSIMFDWDWEASN